MSAPVSHLRAIGFAIAAFTFWVLCDGAIKLGGQSQLPNYEIIAILGLFIAAFIAAYAFWRGDLRALWPKRPTRMLGRALLDLGNTFFVVVALRHLSLTLFYILVFVSPMVVVLLGRLCLQERLDWRKVSATLLGFLGVVIAVDPLRLTGNADWIGYGACAICVSCFSSVIVWSRIISKTESAESMTFFSGIVSAAAGLSGMLVYAVPVNARLMAILLVMGILCVLGNLCFFIAVKHTTAATVSQYHYTQLISGMLVAYVVFHERPTLYMMLGASLIIASGAYIAVTAARSRSDGLV